MVKWRTTASGVFHSKNKRNFREKLENKAGRRTLCLHPFPAFQKYFPLKKLSLSLTLCLSLNSNPNPNGSEQKTASVEKSITLSVNLF